MKPYEVIIIIAAILVALVLICAGMYASGYDKAEREYAPCETFKGRGTVPERCMK